MDAQTLSNAVGCSLSVAETYYDFLSSAMEEFDISTSARQAAFLAQIGHESGSFRYTAEIWGPTEAQKRYEGRQDLGNVYPGDGERFKGRGFIQITGRDNYTEIAEALCIDCVNHPEILEHPEWACVTAAWWWNRHGCNRLADNGQFDRITRTINGGLNGNDDRHARWERAKRVLCA